MTDPKEDCCFDGWARSNRDRARSDGFGAPITRRLVEALEAEGLQGRTVLDVGCGTGDLALACVARGATHATGIDLGPGAIDAARALADERGLSDRSTFVVGDGSDASLPKADVVVLNRVVCCYPDPRGLLDRSIASTGAVIAVTAPVDRGFGGLYNRVSIAIENACYAIRRNKYKGFRAFVHDLRDVDAQITAAGFTLRSHDRQGVVWDLSVYGR